MTTKKECFYIGVILVLAVMLNVVIIKGALDRNSAEEKAELDAYVACVLDQDARQGWIVRNECSPNWRTLDAKAGFTYTQRGYDIYLNK